MLRMALRKNSMWLEVQANVMVNSTARKPENQSLLNPGIDLASQLVSIPLESYRNR